MTHNVPIDKIKAPTLQVITCENSISCDCPNKEETYGVP